MIFRQSLTRFVIEVWGKNEKMLIELFSFYFLLLIRLSVATAPIKTMTKTTPTAVMGNSGTEGEGCVEPKMLVSITL